MPTVAKIQVWELTDFEIFILDNCDIGAFLNWKEAMTKLMAIAGHLLLPANRSKNGRLGQKTVHRFAIWCRRNSILKTIRGSGEV
mmetsp:Transcript_109669/g.171510  ORF Transcript_109669/g.171510 Transcript_109669/m.171510 type:complete len:85 (+) Transcript_109669:95-349(+)